MKPYLLLIIICSACCSFAALNDVHENFDYGPKVNDNIPGWYDQTNLSEYYNKAGDPNSPFSSDTGSIGFHWDQGTDQYIYLFLGTYGGEPSVRFSFLVGNYNGTPQGKVQPGEFLVGIYKNNTLIAADNLDVAADTDTTVIDSVREPFELTGPGVTLPISGNLQLPSENLNEGDRLYFRIQFTNPYNHTFNVDAVFVSVEE